MDPLDPLLGEEKRPSEAETEVFPKFYREQGEWKVQEAEDAAVRDATEMEAYLCREVEMWRRPMSQSVMRDECQACGKKYQGKIDDLQRDLALIQLQMASPEEENQDVDQDQGDLPGNL